METSYTSTKFISCYAPEPLASYIESQGYRAVRVPLCPSAPAPIAHHPDIVMCRLGVSDSAPVITAADCGITIGSAYPADVPLNAACTGKFFVHRLSATAPALLEAARNAGMTPVDVRQGYAKCSVVVVDESSIITYDKGIALACRARGMSVLLVRPGHVRLDGYDTGFIGGTSGRVGKEVVFNGNLSQHPDFKEIVGFIEARGLRCKWFEGWELTDIGSII